MVHKNELKNTTDDLCFSLFPSLSLCDKARNPTCSTKLPWSPTFDGTCMFILDENIPWDFLENSS